MRKTPTKRLFISVWPGSMSVVDYIGTLIWKDTIPKFGALNFVRAEKGRSTLSMSVFMAFCS